jgi:Prokaryotic cytochrome b561
MKFSQPYQPLVLRILHGLTGLFLVAAILTAFWTYNTFDGRWGKLPLPYYPDIEGLHGTFGLFTLLVFPLFMLYAFHRGQKKLLQPDFLAKLNQFGKPVWWYNLNRFSNTLIILALTFAVFSGKMMDEKWLPNGELDRVWYYAHLISWVIIIGCIGLHLPLNAKVGGLPLLLSMLNWRFRAKDNPALWSTNIAAWWSGRRSRQLSLRSNSLLTVLEMLMLISIMAAWIIPLFKEF